MKSIFQKDDDATCYYCKLPTTEVHHVRMNNMSRKRCEELGLVVHLCRLHHHQIHNYGYAKWCLQCDAQARMEETMSHEEYMNIVGKSYL